MIEFADKVKFVREKLQLSQEKFASLLGVSFATVNRWERGHSLPTYIAQVKFDELCKNNGIVFNQEENL